MNKSLNGFRMIALAGALATALAGCAGSQTKESTGEILDDSVITTKVKSDLALQKDVSATSIHVDTYEGVVTLSGKVKSQAEADKAVHIAREIKGVKSVVNNMHVKS